VFGYEVCAAAIGQRFACYLYAWNGALTIEVSMHIVVLAVGNLGFDETLVLRQGKGARDFQTVKAVPLTDGWSNK
jgi:hypothetical protein